MHMTTAILIAVAIYCVAMYLYAAFRCYRYRENHELVTSALGICFILAIGFLGLGA